MTGPGAASSAVVTVRPSGISFAVTGGETVMAAAERAGFSWPTTCHGIGECRACVMAVVSDDLDALGPSDALEADAIAAIASSLAGDPRRWRLACQATVRGDVEVRKVGVRPS